MHQGIASSISQWVIGLLLFANYHVVFEDFGPIWLCITFHAQQFANYQVISSLYISFKDSNQNHPQLWS